MLQSDFVVGWKNIRRADYVGDSHGYTCEQNAVGTTNGAGPRNTQIFVLSPDGYVLHCLPGFWHPDDLARELALARALHRLWKDDRSVESKRALFARMQIGALRSHPPEMVARSTWQGFDVAEERKRLAHGPRDTFYDDGQSRPARLKPLNVLVHERMARRPFVKFSRFDTDDFIDYGRPYYDNNVRVDGMGVRFGSKGYMASQKRMADRRQKRARGRQRDAPADEATPRERSDERRRLEKKDRPKRKPARRGAI